MRLQSVFHERKGCPLLRIRLVSFLLILLLLPVIPAQAAASISLEPGDLELKYSFYLPDERFVLLSYSAPQENGKMVLYSEDGNFEGVISLRYSQAGGKVSVTAENLRNERQLAKGNIKLGAAPGYSKPRGKASGKVSSLTLEETTEGLKYSFACSGTDYMQLKVRNKQQSFTFPVYPQENGYYTGEVTLPLTYARTLSTVQVLSGSGTVMAEEKVRKGYEAPAAAERQEGRLSGVTVCIDPGHSEVGRPVLEPLGPGLEGKTAGTSGMAQGTITQRKESIVVLEISMKLRDELLRQGADVVMTRERQDQFLSNIERCDVAENAEADIMLRLHADTRASSNNYGFSIYAPLNSTYARAVAQPPEYRAMGELLIDAMKTSVGYALEDKYGYVHLSDDFVGNNWAKMVCFLVEMGFMSTPQEDYLLSAPVWQQWLAEGMAQGVYDIAVYRGWISQENP